jgi:tetraacyldisaccharide-1-P 4'-kinase
MQQLLPSPLRLRLPAHPFGLHQWLPAGSARETTQAAAAAAAAVVVGGAAVGGAAVGGAAAAAVGVDSQALVVVVVQQFSLVAMTLAGWRWRVVQGWA